jgi:hypothetical protein
VTDEPGDPEGGTGAGEMFDPPLEPAPPAEPVAVSDDDLREAVGVERRDRGKQADEHEHEHEHVDVDVGEHDDDRDRDHEVPLTPAQRARRRRMYVVGSLILVVGLVVLAFVVLGRANAGRLVFVCSADHISAEQGRSFPPWGTTGLDGPEWEPIAIPPQAECQTRETGDPAELEGWFLDALIHQASARLGAQEVTDVDGADKDLHQALLLARAPERRDQRHEIERLLGDVAFWRGTAKVKAATAALGEAAALFDQAATRRPRNVASSAAWADFARSVATDLTAGPESLRPPAPIGPPVGPGHVPAPPGVALPIGPTTPDAAPGAPIASPDGGVPSGGVLL